MVVGQAPHPAPRVGAPVASSPRGYRTIRPVVDSIGIDCYIAGERAAGPIVVAIPPMWVPARLRMVDLVTAVAPFATGFTMDGPCVAGSGDPPVGEPDYFVKRYRCGVGTFAHFYLASLEQCRLDIWHRPVVLVGHCAGGWIATELVRRGLRPRRLVLSTLPPWTNDLISTYGMGIVLDRGHGLWEYDLSGYQKLHPDDEVTELDVEKANARARRVQPLRHLPFLDPAVSSFAQCVPPEIRATESCRTVLLHPEKDIFSRETRQALATELGAELILLPNEVHDPTSESWPIWRAAFVRLIREALVEDGGLLEAGG
jgi:pimeloyl-ACP methyl ester carboxylesterase